MGKIIQIKYNQETKKIIVTLEVPKEEIIGLKLNPELKQ
jgi:hypothetical protein